MFDTYILKIDRKFEKNEFNNLLCYVSEEKKVRIDRSFKFNNAQRTLLGDVLARYAICKRLSVRNNDLVFGINEYGKPILREPEGINFNISHSGNWVACVIDDNPVGIDVEIIKPIDLKIAERFFSRDEYLSIMRQSEEMKLMYFYKLWTLKESYIKMEGKGLYIPLSSFTIRIVDNNAGVTIEDKIQECYFNQFDIDKNVVCSVSTKNNNMNESIHRSRQEDFYKEAKRLFA